MRLRAPAAALLALGVVASWPMPGAAETGGEPTFEIGLAVDESELRIEFAGRQPLAWGEGDRAGSETTAGPIVVRVSGAQAIVTPQDRARAVPLTVLAAGDTLWVGGARLAQGESGALQWNGKHWRGRFKLFLNPRGKLTLVSRLPLERYLLGVVPGEIGALADSLLEAGRAQAIAARSYTLFYRGRRAAEGFDLYGTVEDQVYGGLESERPLASRCVESTRGRVAMSEGEPIRANYSSTCGGITAEAWEAWPTGGFRYLVSHPDGEAGSDFCAASPQYRWREEWSERELAANLARQAPAFGVPVPAAGVGEIVDVRVAARSRSGRVWRLQVQTTTGTIEIPSFSLRQVLRRGGNAAAILRSNLFKIGVRRDPDTRRALAIVATGGGSGHGVGLCQTGALAMARRGARSGEILSHYYVGVELKTLYE